MPSHQITAIIERERLPLIRARTNLSLAEAALNGIVARLAAGDTNLGAGKPYDIVRKARTAVYEARDAMDEARFTALGIRSINGCILTANDRDDMGDALIHAIDLIKTGTREAAGDLDEGNRLGASDYGVGRAA